MWWPGVERQKQEQAEQALCRGHVVRGSTTPLRCADGILLQDNPTMKWVTWNRSRQKVPGTRVQTGQLVTYFPGTECKSHPSCQLLPMRPVWLANGRQGDVKGTTLGSRGANKNRKVGARSKPKRRARTRDSVRCDAVEPNLGAMGYRRHTEK